MVQQVNHIVGSIIKLNGFVTLKHDILGMNLKQLESTLGLMTGTFEKGAVVALLERHELNRLLNGEVDFEYFGDTRIPEHKFSRFKNKSLDKNELKQNILVYLKGAKPDIVKVFAIEKTILTRDLDKRYPIGNGGALQLKLNESLNFTIISIIDKYPYGPFLY